MSIGTSGRIVIEVDPDVKRRLYALLATEGMSLKEWFLRNATAYIEDSHQMPLFFAEMPGEEHSQRFPGPPAPIRLEK